MSPVVGCEPKGSELPLAHATRGCLGAPSLQGWLLLYLGGDGEGLGGVGESTLSTRAGEARDAEGFDGPEPAL